jgi:hypothetical protein
LLPIRDPTFGSFSMAGLSRAVATMVVGNLLQHTRKGSFRKRQQDAQQQADLGKRQHRIFF